MDLQTEPIKSRKIIKEEMNLCEFPFASLTYQRVKEPLEFSDTYKDKATGQMITRKWCVDGSLKHGVPIAADEDVLMGAFYLTALGNNIARNDRTVNFRIFELLRAVNWPLSRQYYDLFKASLFRLFHCKITAISSFWDKTTEKLISIEGFGLIDNFKIYGKKTGDFEHDNHIWDLDFVSIAWNEAIWKSMRAGYIKSTDLSFYASLERPLSKRLFRYADKVFNRGKKLKKPVKILCCEHLGMSRNYNLGQIKRELNKAVKELEQKGFCLQAAYLNFKQYLRDKEYYLKQGYEAKNDKSLKDFIVLEPAPKKLLAEGVSLQNLSAVIPPAQAVEKTIDAEGLVTCFLTKMRHKREPMPKEILQAQELISKYGALKAKKIIEYAVLKVMEAFSEPTEYFGGLLVYEERALGRIENDEKRIKADEEQKQKEDAESKMLLAEESAHAKIKAVIELLSAKERAELEADARQNLLKRGVSERFISPLSLDFESIDIIRARLQIKES